MTRRSRADEAGYVAIVVSILLPIVFLGCAAVGVDTARWYLEVERVQRAADAAALAGVPYLPQDMTSATTLAKTVSARNGYTHGVDGATVTVDRGSRPSQLRVTVSAVVDNTFGATLGFSTTRITKTAVADYTGPAPMGSPCNTFGNEPPSQPGAAQPTGSALPATPVNPFCVSRPYFWAAIEGPETDKVQGDRYSTIDCGSSNVSGGGVYGCVSGKNPEYVSEGHKGYFFVVKVEPGAVGTPIRMQLYDPAFVFTSVNCQSLPNNADLSLSNKFTNNMNSYVTTDGIARYSNTANAYCSGDYFPGKNGTNYNPITTSFAMRQQTDTYDPMKAPVISGCVKQFRGRTSAPTSSLLRERLLNSSGGQTTTANSSYDAGLAKVFHSWVDLCTFTPTRSGDYYLQVRTNVALGGTAEPNGTKTSITYSGNSAVTAEQGNTTAGEGLNSFGIRAAPTVASKANQISVAGWSRMPILQNSPASKATFNLIRALPGAAGQFITFDFFDAGDGATTTTAKVHVMRPTDATGSIASTVELQGCRGAKNDGTWVTIANCTVDVKNSTHDGQLQSISIPVPNDYNCTATSLGGCWFRVEITFPGTVTDFTTWDATIVGDPVRLIE